MASTGTGRRAEFRAARAACADRTSRDGCATPPKSGGTPARAQSANFCARPAPAAPELKVRGCVRQGGRAQVPSQGRVPWQAGGPWPGAKAQALVLRGVSAARAKVRGFVRQRVRSWLQMHANQVLHQAAPPVSAQKFAPCGRFTVFTAACLHKGSHFASQQDLDCAVLPTCFRKAIGSAVHGPRPGCGLRVWKARLPNCQQAF